MVTGGEEDDEMQWWRVGLPVIPTRFDLGFLGGEWWCCGKSHTKSYQSPPLFIAYGDRGPLAIDRLGTLDHGASQGSIRPLGLINGRSI